MLSLECSTRTTMQIFIHQTMADGASKGKIYRTIETIKQRIHNIKQRQSKQFRPGGPDS